MKFRAATIAVLISLLLCGCYESELPLSLPAESKPDCDLAGLWVSKEDSNNHIYLHVIVDSTKQMRLNQSQSSCLESRRSCRSAGVVNISYEGRTLLPFSVPVCENEPA